MEFSMVYRIPGGIKGNHWNLTEFTWIWGNPRKSVEFSMIHVILKESKEIIRF